MGVTCTLSTLSDANIERLVADPPLVWRVVAPQDRSVYERERRAGLPLLARLMGKSAPPAPELELGPGEGDVLDLDKVWTSLQLALTGTDVGGDPPLDFLTDGGRDIGTIDVGYGPAHAFTSQETLAIADAIANVDEATVRRRFDPAEMEANGLDPSVWDPEAVEFALEYLAPLRQFLADAVRHRCGFVIWF